MTSNQDPAVSTLLTLIDQAASELTKAKRDLLKAQQREKEAEMRVKTLNEAVDAVRGTTHEKSVRDWMVELIGHDLISAGDILEKMVAEGYPPNPKNPTAAILTTATRLVKEGVLEIDTTSSPQRYRKPIEQEGLPDDCDF